MAEGKVNCDTFVVSGGGRIVTVEFERERVGVRRLLWRTEWSRTANAATRWCLWYLRVGG